MSTHYETLRRRAYQKLWNKLDEHLLPLMHDGIVLAVSGGPDSRALLESVATWPNRRTGKILVVAIDHGLRKDAAQEALMVQWRARRLGFHGSGERLQMIATGEHELRHKRYEALFRSAQRNNLRTIVTAHQGDDDAEGYLMALMGVGGGELGAAMQEREQIGDLVICRPFLTLDKSDLLLALSLSKHTDFVRDSCDESRMGQRAFVRHEVVPELVRHTPKLLKRLHHIGRAQAKQRDVVDKLAQALITWQGETAILSLEPRPDQALLVSALWQIIKYFGDGKDLRSAGSLISSIAADVSIDEIIKNHAKPGLDPRLNGFNLKALSVKLYQVPGAVVFRGKSEIQVKRN